jgi:hypothetical protein
MHNIYKRVCGFVVIAATMMVVSCQSNRCSVDSRSRDSCVKEMFARIANGELLGADSKMVGKALKGPKWESEVTICVVYGGIGKGPFYPRIIAHLYPEKDGNPEGWSPYQLELDFTGSSIRNGERVDAERFLNGTLESEDTKNSPRIWRYVVTDHDINREITQTKITINRITETNVVTLSVSNLSAGIRVKSLCLGKVNVR